jgi:23S rRNA pseudouridine1911/1915/1917 synthase
MAKEKAYKVLAQQLDISNKKAKDLIDRGLVFVGDRQVKIARAELDSQTKFRVEYPSDIEVIYEDSNIIAINKPAQVDSYDIEGVLEEARLLHRLDRDTSGVLLFGKNEEFITKAIRAFKNREVIKEYVAWVDGVFYEEMVIDEPIHTIKKGKAFSLIDPVRGKKAVTIVKPQEVQGKKSKVDIEIKTGRTHQIRVHLAHIGYPIIGDELYGSPTKSKRILLHAKRVKILDYEFEAKEPNDIQRYK